MGVSKNSALSLLTSAMAAADQVSPGFDIGTAVSDTAIGPILGMLASVLVTLWRITTPLPPIDPADRTRQAD
jgi:hypothetical protein